MQKNSFRKVVTIDGPSASGKTSVSREIAKLLNWSWISTGAFYKAVALMVKRQHMHPLEESQIVDMIKANKNWNVVMQPEKTVIYLEGQDVSDTASGEDLADLASQISRFPKVREVLLQPQRDCLKKIHKGLIAEGRDCGTVVFPDAPLKIYLTASHYLRGKRRALEMGLTDRKVLEYQQKRDLRDTQRQIAPLKIPAGAYKIDTSQMDILSVVDFILKKIKALRLLS